MAVDPGSLIAPFGPVEPDMFPGEGEGDNTALHTRLTNYIQKAEAKVSALGITDETQVDEAVEAWALYLAFRAAYTLTLARPAEDDAQTDVLGRTRFDKDQRDGMKQLADSYFNQYQLLTMTVDSKSAASKGVPSYQTKNNFDW